MSEDPRCCGTGTCIINADGLCWCGQRWDGEKMSFSKPESSPAEPVNPSPVQPVQPAQPGQDASGTHRS